jgi:hypothetical protein
MSSDPRPGAARGAAPAVQPRLPDGQEERTVRLPPVLPPFWQRRHVLTWTTSRR